MENTSAMVGLGIQRVITVEVKRLYWIYKPVIRYGFAQEVTVQIIFTVTVITHLSGFHWVNHYEINWTCIKQSIKIICVCFSILFHFRIFIYIFHNIIDKTVDHLLFTDVLHINETSTLVANQTNIPIQIQTTI